MTHHASRVALAAVLVAAGVVSGPARADVTKSQCIDANTRGQELRRDGKLSAAGEAFRTCSVPSCPALLRDDCTRRLDEIEHAQPTIVFDAKDAGGRDLSAVKVTVDGKPLTERLTGAPLAVDPGEHVFTFEVAGQPPSSQTFVVKEGEKDRRERIVLGGGAAPAPTPSGPAQGPAPASPPASSAPPPDEGMGTRKILGLTAAGLGVVGVGVGAVFGLMTSSQASQQKTDCASATSCKSHDAALSDHSSASTDGAISTASFIAGGVLLAVGGVLFFTGGHAAEPGATTALVVAPSVGPGGAGMLLKGEF
jgi:hypothetical protein